MTKPLTLVLLLLSFSLSAQTPDDGWGNVFKFQTKMAEIGNVKAQYILGEMYEDGRGVTQNDSKAIEWYKKAQQNGHKNAANRINQLKSKRVAEKLQKQNAKVKLRKKKEKSKKAKKAIAAKKQKIKKIKAAKKILTPTIPPKPEPIPVPVKRANASPEDFKRGIGTHLDDSEDPFD